MRSNFAIRVSNLSKKYLINNDEGRKNRLLRLTAEILGIKTKDTEVQGGEFWALRDISFEIEPGQSLGVVGLNGAGKSTLLKVILGRIKQNRGDVVINGTAGGLIELSAGFHPELDGIRNIYNKGVLLGKSKEEIDSKLDEIIRFALVLEFNGRLHHAEVVAYMQRAGRLDAGKNPHGVEGSRQGRRVQAALGKLDFSFFNRMRNFRPAGGRSQSA